MAGIGIDLPTIVGQLVSFLILMGVLIFVGYRPIRRMLDERADKIKEGMAQAKQAGGFDDTSDIPFAPFMKGEW